MPCIQKREIPGREEAHRLITAFAPDHVSFYRRRMLGFVTGVGVIAVQGEQPKRSFWLTDEETHAIILRSLGFDRSKIATELQYSESQVKRMILAGVDKLGGSQGRAAYQLFESGLCSIIAPSERLQVCPSEQQAVDQIIHGKTNEKAGAALCKGATTIKSQLGHVFKVNNLSSRAEVTMRALTSDTSVFFSATAPQQQPFRTHEAAVKFATQFFNDQLLAQEAIASSM